MSFLFVTKGRTFHKKCVNIFFSHTAHVRERGKAVFCDLRYNKADERSGVFTE